MKESPPYVSVLIPSYNRAAFLPMAIASVLNQSFEDFELIIQDNGSTDNTKAIVEQFDDPRIKYYYIKHISFISKARNKIMQSASGQYIAFLDSDDIWEPHKLASQLATLDHFQADVSFSKATLLFADGRTKTSRFPLTLSKQSTQKEILHHFVMNELMVYPSTLIFKRSVLDKTHGFDTFLGGTEMEFISRLITQFKVICDPEGHVIIKKHRDNYSILVNIEEVFSEKFWILENLLKSKKISQKCYQTAMFTHIQAMMRSKNPRLKINRFLHYLLRCIRLYPFSMMNLTAVVVWIKGLLHK